MRVPNVVVRRPADNDLGQLAADYEDKSYDDTLLEVVQPNDETQRYYELDVTKYVYDDYAADELSEVDPNLWTAKWVD